MGGCGIDQHMNNFYFRVVDRDLFKHFIPQYRGNQYIAFVNIVQHFFAFHGLLKSDYHYLTNLLLVVLKSLFNITQAFSCLAALFAAKIQSPRPARAPAEYQCLHPQPLLLAEKNGPFLWVGK